MYNSAENGYAALDFTGLGYVTEKSFLDCYLVKERLKYSRSQVQEFFQEYNLFNDNEKGINFDNFKKNFFPHLYLCQDEKDDAEDIKAHNLRN